MSHFGAGEVPLKQFRDAFLKSGMTISEFARKMKYVHTTPNIDRARRALGLRQDTDSRARVDADGVPIPRRRRARQTVRYAQAVKIADALHEATGLEYTDYEGV